MTTICDCEHHTHDPAGVGKATEHDYGATVTSVSTIRSPWGGTFRICPPGVDAGHRQGRQFR